MKDKTKIKDNDSPNKESKTAYQTPTLIDLGELARGSGRCNQGSNGSAQPGCVQGNNP